MFLPDLPSGISDFYAAYTNSGIDNQDNSKFIFDEKNIVIGIMIPLYTSVGVSYYSSIEKNISDLYAKVGNDYILIAGNTILLKDKIIRINYDSFEMYDLNYINDRILIKWPESYVNSESISKGRYNLYNLGIDVKQEIDKSEDQAKQLEKPNLAYELKDKVFYKNLISDKGIVIHKIKTGSTADKAGLKSGDILSEIRGFHVTMPYLFQLIVEGYAKEGKFNIKYLRDGKEYDTIVTL